MKRSDLETLDNSEPRGVLRIPRMVYYNPWLNSSENQAFMSMREAGTRIGVDLVACRNEEEVEAADPDFVISMTSALPKVTRYPTYLNLHEPTLYLHDIPNRFRNVFSYDGYLTVSDSLVRFCKDLCSGTGRVEEPGFFYCTPQINSLSFDWDDPVAVRRLKVVYFGTNWSPRMPHLFRALDETGVLRIHGPQHSWEQQGLKGYAGPVPFDGVGPQRAYAEFGIGLAMMDDRWIQEDVISNRIFEISSVGAVAICPDMPWTRKWFGDTVLYFDASRPVEEIAEVVRTHHAFCAANPARAGAMARAARQIFERHFSAERMLSNAYDYHLRKQSEHAAQLAAMPPPPEVSVILRCGGRSLDYVRCAVDSIRAQTYGRFRVIFAKYREIDLSPIETDRSGAISAFETFLIPGGGRAEMLYSAAQRISTPYFAVLDDDDFWLPEHMETLFRTGRLVDPEFDMAFSGVVNFDNPQEYAPGVTFSRTIGRFGFETPLQSAREIVGFIWVCSFVARSDLIAPQIFEVPSMRTAEDSLFVCLLARRTRPVFSWRATAFYRFGSPDGSNWQHDPQRDDDLMSQTLRAGLLLAPRWLPASSQAALDHQLPEARRRLGATILGELLHRVNVTEAGKRINSRSITCAAESNGQLTYGPFYRLGPGHYLLMALIVPNPGAVGEVLGELRVDGSPSRGTFGRAEIRRDEQRVVVPFTITPERADADIEFLCFAWGSGGFTIVSMALHDVDAQAYAAASAPAPCAAPVEVWAAPEPERSTYQVSDDRHAVLAQHLTGLYESRSWRMTEPLRVVSRRVRGQQAVAALTPPLLTNGIDPVARIDEMERQIAAIHTSTSWKATAPMRSLARGIRALLHR